MPELLLRDEQQVTGEWKEELRSGATAAFFDANVLLQCARYADYLLRCGQIWSVVYKLDGGEEEKNIQEDIASSQVLIQGTLSALAAGWQRYYHHAFLLVAGTAFEEAHVEPHDIEYARRGEATIPAVLSRTVELFGYGLQRQLELSIEGPAFNLLENSTMVSLTQKVLHMIALEKRKGTSIKSVSLTSFRDPEARDFEQLVVTVHLDCDSDTALQLWDSLSKGIEELKKELSLHEISILNEGLGLDCEW